MTTLAQLDAASASFTLNSTAWALSTTNSSNAVDLSGSPNPVDVQITVKITFPNSAMGQQKAVNVFVSCSEDGTNYDDNDQYSGTNNHQTALRSPTNFKYAGSIAATINVATAMTFSLLSVCGGSLPRKFGIILENQCNQTIATFTATYTLVNYTNT